MESVTASASLTCLPTEVLTLIVEHASPQPSQRSFHERSVSLRGLALVHSNLTRVAQNALLVHVEVQGRDRAEAMNAGYLDGTLGLRRIKSMSLQPGQQGNEEVLDLLLCCRGLKKVWLGDAEDEDGPLFKALARLPSKLSLQCSRRRADQ